LLAPRERRGLIWSFLYFFALLSGYYVLRPVRDEMGITGGIEKLPWMFTGTFLATFLAVALFTWVVTRAPRRRIIPIVYQFAAVNLVAFWVALRLGAPKPVVARVFFIWLSVYNVFVTSVFWSFMADVWTDEQGKRLFGIVAAGGTAGAVIGPTLTTALAPSLGPANLLLLAVLLLETAILCVFRLVAWSREEPAGGALLARVADVKIGGDLLGGFRKLVRSPWLLAIAALTILTTTTATFLYLQQARIVQRHVADPGQRTALFAGIDLAANALTLVVQAFLIGRLLRWAGVGVALAVVAVISAAGFGALAAAPTLGVLIAFQIVRRAAHYGVERPARELLFTRSDEEEKYKSKSFVDTLVYRGGDAASAWAYAGLGSLGLSAAGVSLTMLPLCGAWLLACLAVGRGFAKRGEPA
jgi:AAA family ATP:ADP antiporter